MIYDEDERRIMIMGGDNIGVVGTTLTEGNQEEINGLAFYEINPLLSEKEQSLQYDPKEVSTMPIHIIFKSPDSVENMIKYLEKVKRSMQFARWTEIDEWKERRSRK